MYRSKNLPKLDEEDTNAMSGAQLELRKNEQISSPNTIHVLKC
jgi:hypothetical protein